MPKGILLVQSRPVSADKEDEYNRWYDEVHIPDIRKIPGFVAARRFRAQEAGGLKLGPQNSPYVIIYEIEADDLSVPVEELGARFASGEVTLSDTIDQPSVTAVYRLIE